MVVLLTKLSLKRFEAIIEDFCRIYRDVLVLFLGVRPPTEKVFGMDDLKASISAAVL